MDAPILRRIVLSVIVILGLLVAGVIMIQVAAALKPDPEQVDTPPPPIVATAMELRRQAVVEKIRGYGVANPIRRADVSARVNGVVDDIPEGHREGAFVSRGTVLLSIDRAEYVARLDRARAALAESREEIERNRVELEETIRKRELIRKDIDLAAAELARTEELLTEGALSESARDQARSALQSAQQRLSDNSRQEAILRTSTNRLQAVLDARQSEIKLAELDLEYTTPVAPFDGYIEQRMVDEGDLVQPGKSLIVLVDPSRLEMPIEIPASRAAAVTTGKAVALSTDTAPPISLSGEVARVAPSITPQSRTITAYVVMDAQVGDYRLTPGVFLSAEVDARRFEDVYAVPRQCILDGHIYIAVDGIARRLTPDFFIMLEDTALTRDNLGEGTLLITSGFERLYDGAPVEVPEFPSIPAEPGKPAEPVAPGAAENVG